MIRIYRLAFIFILIFTACAKEESRSNMIPETRVEIDIQTQLENEFNNPLHSKKYYSGKNGIKYAGYVGVIAISNTEASWLYAYDLCCPYEAPQKNELEMDGTVRVKCPKCGSIYSLLYRGQPESGPATERLKEYRVRKDGLFYRIRN